MHRQSGLAVALALACAAGCGGGVESWPTVTAKRSRLRVTAEPAVAVRIPAGVPPVDGVGTFRGSVVFDGPVPRRGLPSGFDPDKATTDKFCVGRKTLIQDESLIVDSATHGVKNVAVFLLSKPASYSLRVPDTPVRFRNRNCRFEPRMLALIAGQQVTISNDDPTTHNTQISPFNPLSRSINPSLVSGMTATYVYGGPEKFPVKVTCSFHPWMLAYHLPLDHEFFAVTNDKGEFEIKGLPAGTHTFRLWQESAGYLEREIRITIKAGGTNDRTFKYAPSKFASFHGPAPKAVAVSLTSSSTPRLVP